MGVFFLAGFLLLAGSLPAYALNNAADNNSSQANQEITVSQAIDMAKTNSIKLRQAQMSVDDSNELRDRAADNVRLQSIPTAYGISPGEASAWISLLNADLGVRGAEVQQQLAEDLLEINVPQAYWAVQSALAAEKYAESALEVADLQSRIAQLSYQAGMKSQTEATIAKNNYDQAKVALDQAKNNVDKAYLAFNQLIGLPASARPILSDTPQYEAMQNVDIDHEVARVLTESPSLTLYALQIDKAKYQENIVGSGSSYTPYSVRHNAVVSAELDEKNARDTLEQTVRNLYTQLLDTEQKYQDANLKLQQAQENLRVVKAQEEAGLATSLQVKQAELAVAQAQLNLDTLTRQHASQKLAFEKPWAASGSGGGSTAGQSQGNAQ